MANSKYVPKYEGTIGFHLTSFGDRRKISIRPIQYLHEESSGWRKDHVQTEKKKYHREVLKFILMHS